MSGADEAYSAGVVGPNAVIQLSNALDDLCGHPLAEAVFAQGGYPDLIDNPPDSMISETVPAGLMDVLWTSLSPAEAEAVARDAGRRTADYVIANRIPHAAKWLLARVPRVIGARLLLKAVHRNAWTFCGSGVCTVKMVPALTLTLKSNPIRTPGCIWHVAVFEQLFGRLVSPEIQVIHAVHSTEGQTVDRFEFRIRCARPETEMA
ncbi:bacteriochlorophyll 4-vinyl reductase [Roseibium sp. MMSF_3544]|uniref:bacteriochlorophyll 4-vinyl reductase n=1 Tax=unclassified Roseibium TaxID=2629323 RepID=UPI00273E766E|nr:bacteriochlorophyll 4-vinyl reductase [Roseibium sp. MMSF_3544]